MESMLFFIGS